MLTGIHFLLTYICNYECDHCFLHCGPRAEGTFTLARLREALEQIKDLGGIKSVYFEGGEPFLFYPLLVEGVRLAKAQGLNVGIVTNSYWATAGEDARLWLDRLNELGLSDLSVSDDGFHSADESASPAKIACREAKALGMPCSSICIEQPQKAAESLRKGLPVVGGEAQVRGRAADKLAEGLPRHSAACFTHCPHEDLRRPKRVHVDPFGYVHLCQGVVIGCMWEKPLKVLIEEYDPEAHPVSGPLLRGGPQGLAREYKVPLDEAGYVDACHLCYLTRKALVGKMPEYLAPRQVYGLEAGG
ncbi:radical SAM protein [Elusimicrobiota bacterium]